MTVLIATTTSLYFINQLFNYFFILILVLMFVSFLVLIPNNLACKNQTKQINGNTNKTINK